MNDKNVVDGMDCSEASDNSGDSEKDKEMDSVMKGQSNDSRSADENKKHTKKSKDFEQCPFEIIDTIAKTMTKLEKLQFVVVLTRMNQKITCMLR